VRRLIAPGAAPLVHRTMIAEAPPGTEPPAALLPVQPVRGAAHGATADRSLPLVQPARDVRAAPTTPDTGGASFAGVIQRLWGEAALEAPDAPRRVDADAAAPPEPAAPVASAAPVPDLDVLAQQVYARLRERLRADSERRGR